MRDLSGTTAAVEKDKQAYRVVWLVEVATTLVADGSDVTLRYANREYVLDGQAYTDGLNPDGIALGWATLRERGGLAPVADMSVRLAAAGGMAGTLSAYRLDNSTVRLYVVFVTGAETASDKVLLQTSTVESVTWTQESITLRCIDTSDQGWREVPTHRVNLGEHPNAPLEEYGKPVPQTYGLFTGGITSAAPCYASMRCLDLFLPAYTAGYRSGATPSSKLCEWVPEARAMAQFGLFGYYRTDFEALTPPALGPLVGPRYDTRYLRLAPLLPGADNTCADWRKALDNDADTCANVASGQVLSLQWPGAGTPGTIDHAWLMVQFTNDSPGAGDVTVYFGDDELASYTGRTVLLYEDLQPLLGDAFVEAWHLEQLKVKVAPTTSDPVEVTSVVLLTHYYGNGATDRTARRDLFLTELDGYRSSTDHQNHVIAGTEAQPCAGPATQLAAVLSGKDMFDLPVDAFHAASWAAAYAARDNDGTNPHRTHFQLLRTVGWDFWNALCFEAGLHLFLNAAAQWQLVARDAGAAPVRFFGPADIALTSPRDIGSAPDVSASLTPTRDVVNEVVLRYDYDPATDRHRQVAIRTAQHRYAGSCTVDGTGKTLTDSAAAFSTGDYPAAVGDRVYVTGLFTLVVTSVDSDTQLGIELWDRDPTALANISTPTAYYGGPGVSRKMVDSYLRYGTINPLQGAYDPAQDSGGYVSSFLYADAGQTAEVVLDYMEDWFSQRRMTVELGTYLNAVDVELGDVCLLRCPLLPSDRDAPQEGALSGAIAAGDSSLVCSTTGWPGASAFPVNSYLVIDDEVMLVTGRIEGTQILTVWRGRCATTAAAHAANAPMYLAQVRWEVTGVQPVPASGMVRLRLTEMPAA